MKAVEQVLREVFSHPTAPYREGWVLRHIQNELKRLHIPFYLDTWGNIIAGVKKAGELKKSNRVALVAHTDHPGFHILRKIKKKFWKAQWFGGVPPKASGAKVRIHNPNRPDKSVPGIIKTPIDPKGVKKEFTISVKNDERLHPLCFGAFDFPGHIKRGHRISTRAADDLAGVVIILSTLERLNSKERKNFLGVFTRAEETGFRGALGLIYQKTLGPNIRAISLEASRTLPGARLGLGPVIRLGDKRTLFDSHVTAILDLASEKLKKKDPKIKFQRRIMNGGTCEATAFNLHGTRAAGLAVPLGNYHNQRLDGRPGAEFIDARDVEGAVRLCTEFYKLISQKKDPMEELKKLLSKEFRKDQKLLKTKVKYV